MSKPNQSGLDHVIVYFQDIMLFFAGLMIILISLIHSQKGREEWKEDNHYLICRLEVRGESEFVREPSRVYTASDHSFVYPTFRQSQNEFILICFASKQRITKIANEEHKEDTKFPIQCTISLDATQLQSLRIVKAQISGELNSIGESLLPTEPDEFLKIAEVVDFFNRHYNVSAAFTRPADESKMFKQTM